MLYESLLFKSWNDLMLLNAILSVIWLMNVKNIVNDY